MYLMLSRLNTNPLDTGEKGGENVPWVTDPRGGTLIFSYIRRLGPFFGGSKF